MDNASFWRLRERTLSRIEPGQWDAYYAEMTPWLDSEDAAIRDGALERLIMAVFRAERSDVYRRAGGLDGVVARTRWFLDVLADAQTRHAELVPAFLKALRYHGDDEPFPEILLPWLRRLQAKPDPLVPAALVEGALVLIGDRGTDHREAGARLVALLDHPSTWVRGCAAKRLGEWIDPDDAAAEKEVIDRIVAKELERPGIAGPFWSGWGFDVNFETLPFDLLLWMLDIIERRNGPEPDGMPFNGLDFHVHELAAFSPDVVQRLLDGGRAFLAVQAATEVRDVVEGMRAQLDRLGDVSDPELAHDAHAHLAHYYNVLHPKADPERIRYLPNWRPGVDAYVIRQGGGDIWRDVAVFFPRGRRRFDDAKAWAVLDEALPPTLRGPLATSFLAAPEDEPAPYRLGDDELRDYASGAHLRLCRRTRRGRWRRLEIFGRGLQEQWNPFAWMSKGA